MGLRDLIVSASDTTLELVNVPEWNCDVFIKTMSGLDRDHWEDLAFPGGKVRPQGYRVTLLLVTLCDSAGARIFSDSDIATLSAKSNVIINRLYDISARLNGLRQVDEDTAGKKNADGEPTALAPSK